MTRTIILSSKKLLFVSILLLVGTVAFANQQECPAIRRDHPRMFFNADTWPQVKARANGEAKDYLATLLDIVETLTDNPVAENTGPLNIKEGRQPDGSYVSLIHTNIPPIKEFGREASQCALAWRFTGKDKYLQKAKKMLSVSIAAYTEATSNRRPVSWYATERILALCAYDWIYEALTDEERRNFIVPLVEHVRLVQPDAGLNIPRQPTSTKSQGYYNMNALLWYSGLAADGDGYCDSLAHEHLVRGYRENLEMIDYRNSTAGDDGALSSPAINYACGIYPYAHYNFMHTMYSATGRNIAEDYPQMGLLPNWLWWMWIRDDVRPVFLRHHGLADTMHNINLENMQLMYEHLTSYLWFFGSFDRNMSNLAASMRSFIKTGSFGKEWPMYPYIMDLNYPVTEEDIYNIENCSIKARHFEAVGQFLMRSAWTPDATYASFTAGAKTLRQHKHHDENSFTIYKRDHLALDSGDRGHQNDLNLRYYYGQSVAHNVVLIQKPGEPLPNMWGPSTDDPVLNTNYGGMYDAPATVLSFETGEDFTYIASDATACYGSKCTESVRQFVFLYPDYFIIYDREGAADPSYEKQWLLHFEKEPDIQDNIIKVSSLEGRLFCQNFLPDGAVIEKVGGPGKEFLVHGKNMEINPKTMQNYVINANKSGRGPYCGQWRIEIKPPKAQRNDRFLNVLTAGDNSSPKPVNAKYIKNETQDGVCIKAHRQEYIFWFNRDGKVGGTVETKGRKRPLAEEVEPQSGVIF